MQAISLLKKGADTISNLTCKILENIPAKQLVNLLFLKNIHKEKKQKKTQKQEKF